MSSKTDIRHCAARYPGEETQTHAIRHPYWSGAGRHRDWYLDLSEQRFLP